MSKKKGVIGNDIKKESFEALCKLMCTKQEILSVLGVSESTLDAWVKITYNDTCVSTINALACGGKVKLRQIQMEQAEKNPVMAIWLGKQYLGQTDKVENNNTNKIEFISDMPTDEDDEYDN